MIEKKRQFEEMLSDCRRLDQINNDFLNRIVEMEQKVETLPDLTYGKDTLKKQKTEYKNVKSELNQIKDLFDELKDIHEAIINKYQTNDTSKIKLKYDRLVSRFNEICNR